ncbi:MAG TPA: hypothetical protein VLC55_02185, partial [Burkholderiales bacterium]|nr:hypothetical protein [Burkholderiales bacterium]
MNRKMVYGVSAAGLIGFSLFQPQFVSSQTFQSSFRAVDPGVRGVRSASAGAGGPIDGLTENELLFFQAGKEEFEEADDVEEGLGPTMNLDGCSGCHAHPAVGGTSPKLNPQFDFANRLQLTNIPPSFITKNGPVREARFVKNPDGTPDGGVHALFTIAGSPDAPGCNLAQPNFARELQNDNVIFRIPTPLFGAGLIEQIPDNAILANQAANATQKRSLGIFGRANFAVSGRTVS